jgi:hypothetical protein
MANPYTAPKSKIEGPGERRPPLPAPLLWAVIAFGLLIVTHLVLVSFDGTLDYWKVRIISNAVLVGALTATILGADWGRLSVLWICVFICSSIALGVLARDESFPIVQSFRAVIAIACVVLLKHPRARSFCRG